MPPKLELIRQWLGRARTDLNAAQASLTCERPEPAAVCFHCQQAVEKSLKAFLVYRDISFEWSHEIEYLVNLCAAEDKSFEQFRNSAGPLTDYAVRFRYPSEEPDPTPAQAKEALAVANQVYEFVLDRLPLESHPEK